MLAVLSKCTCQVFMLGGMSGLSNANMCTAVRIVLARVR